MGALMGDVDISARLAEAGKRKWDDRTLAQRAADLATELLMLSIKNLHSDERTLLSALSRLATDQRNRRFVHDLCGQVFRAPDPATQAACLKKLLADFGGIPTLFSTVGRLRLRAAAMAAGSMQGAAMAEVRRIFRATFGELSLPTQVEKVNRRVRDLGKDKLTLALNPLSPEVFGNKSAERYQRHLEAILSKQEGVGITVEPWRLVPGISPYRPNQAARVLADRLKELIRLSLKGGDARPIIVETGTSDIIPVVIEGFKQALSGSAFRQANITLELPGYLRQSPALLRELTEWAQARAAKGARPLSVMLDKGSHLAAERACTYLYGEANAAAATKAETDTRYKQLLHQAMAANAKAIRPALATHNLFDLAYGLLDWARNGRSGLPDIVLTAGLGNHIGRMLSRAGARVTLVVGVASEQSEAEFENYLLHIIREAAIPESLLSAGYAPEPNSMPWNRMRQQFLASLSGREEPHSTDPRRRAEDALLPSGTLATALDRAGMDALISAAAERGQEATAPALPLTIGGEVVETPLTGIHRSLTAAGVEEYRFTCADYKAVDRVLQLASRATANEPTALDERRRQLLQLARVLEKHRQELCALLVVDAGFTLADADLELRNAADACRFYEKSAVQDGLLDGTLPLPLGVVVVASDRAHPLAHAVSGIAAAWMAGNCIIFKPTPASLRLGCKLAELAAEAGFTYPRFNIISCLDNQIADKLMVAPQADATLLPGNAALAARLAAAAPGKPILCASAGLASVYLAQGCNWQQAVHELTQAAFRRSGQSTTCPRVVFVDASVYDNQLFMNALKDAVSSLSAQPGWTEAANLGPLSRPLTEEQKRLLTEPQDEETWLVRPHAQGLNSQIWTPGAITGVKAGSPLTTSAARELPLLALIRVTSAAEAITQQKRVSAAGAAAIYAPDEALITQWSQSMSSAHDGVYALFINCCPQERPGLLPEPATALPARHPSPMAGGLHYLTALCHWQENARPQRRGKQRHIPFSPWESLMPKPSPDDTMRLTAAADSISYWWENEFGQQHESTTYEGETITRRYIAHPVCLRAEKATSDIDLAIAIMAALTAGCELQLSVAAQRPWMPRALEPLGLTVHVEPREEFESRFADLAGRGICVRDTAATEATLRHATEAGLQLCTDSVLANGRLELLHYLRESHTCRHGKPAEATE